MRRLIELLLLMLFLAMTQIKPSSSFRPGSRKFVLFGKSNIDRKNAKKLSQQSFHREFRIRPTLKNRSDLHFAESL